MVNANDPSIWGLVPSQAFTHEGSYLFLRRRPSGLSKGDVDPRDFTTAIFAVDSNHCSIVNLRM